MIMQSAYFTKTSLNFMNSPSTVAQTWSNYPERTQTNTKVVIVLLDGMRYDCMSVCLLQCEMADISTDLTQNPTMNAFINDPALAPDMKVYKMRAQLPSMSVPNWISILTSAPPEMTGVMGNLIVPETSYDSIFREAQLFNLNRGLTASPWMADIIRYVCMYALSGR